MHPQSLKWIPSSTHFNIFFSFDIFFFNIYYGDSVCIALLGSMIWQKTPSLHLQNMWSSRRHSVMIIKQPGNSNWVDVMTYILEMASNISRNLWMEMSLDCVKCSLYSGSLLRGNLPLHCPWGYAFKHITLHPQTLYSPLCPLPLPQDVLLQMPQQLHS